MPVWNDRAGGVGRALHNTSPPHKHVTCAQYQWHWCPIDLPIRSFQDNFATGWGLNYATITHPPPHKQLTCTE